MWRLATIFGGERERKENGRQKSQSRLHIFGEKQCHDVQDLLV